MKFRVKFRDGETLIVEAANAQQVRDAHRDRGIATLKVVRNETA